MAFSKKKYGNAIKLLTEQLPTESTEVVFEDVNAILETEVDDKYYMAEGYLETLKRHKIREHEKGHGFGYCVVNQEVGNIRLQTLFLQQVVREKREILYINLKKAFPEK